MVDIIDVGMGNIRSIKNVLSRLGVSCRVVHEPSSLTSRILILPGVGSARPFMQKMCALQFDSAIQQHVSNENKLIGICLGFQVLTDFSEEDGGTKCLGLIKANTIRLSKNYHSSNHNQWEKLSIRKRDLCLSEDFDSLLSCRLSVVRGRVFYNHEYGVNIPFAQEYFAPINSTDLSSFASMYSKDNIIGIQFHPEKSQITGMQLLSLVL